VYFYLYRCRAGVEPSTLNFRLQLLPIDSSDQTIGFGNASSLDSQSAIADLSSTSSSIEDAVKRRERFRYERSKLTENADNYRRVPRSAISRARCRRAICFFIKAIPANRMPLRHHFIPIAIRLPSTRCVRVFPREKSRRSSN